MIVSDMIQSVKDNLGNRNSGRIGGRDIDVVVLEAINLAIPHCVQEAQPDYYNRTCNISLVVGQRVYDLPTKDSDGKVIKIKDFYNHRCWRADGTAVDMKMLNYNEFVKRTINYPLEFTGTPSCFALWGTTNRIHLDYLPSEALTLELYIETYPNIVTAAQSGTALPIDDQWNIVVEAYATKHCYLKLQQTQMYAIWDDLYNREKSSISREESGKQSKNIQVGDSIAQITDPVLNPMVRNWNN